MIPENRQTIFPTKSPVSLLGEQPEAPEPKSRKALREVAEEHSQRLGPLLCAKKEADKVYANGYFEQHYKDADRLLKRLLHEKIMNSWSGAISEDVERDEHKSDEPRGLGRGLSITINTGD